MLRCAMPWNYRVLRHQPPAIQNIQREDYLVIHEVYFDDGRQDAPHSCTMDGVTVGGESVEELRATLEQMLRCLDEPVVDYDAICRLAEKRTS